MRCHRAGAHRSAHEQAGDCSDQPMLQCCMQPPRRMQCVAASPVTMLHSRSCCDLGNARCTPASCFQLPAGPWVSVFDALCACFPSITAERWRDRFTRGLVRDANDQALALSAPYRLGADVRYFREVADEPVIPYVETVVHADAQLVVACKPHFCRWHQPVHTCARRC